MAAWRSSGRVLRMASARTLRVGSAWPCCWGPRPGLRWRPLGFEFWSVQLFICELRKEVAARCRDPPDAILRTDDFKDRSDVALVLQVMQLALQLCGGRGEETEGESQVTKGGEAQAVAGMVSVQHAQQREAKQFTFFGRHGEF